MPEPSKDMTWEEYMAWITSGGGTTTTTTGTKPTGGTPPTYAQSQAADKGKTQLAAGYQPAPPPGSQPIGPGSVTAAGITWHQDPTTLNWSPGYPTTKAEGALAQAVARGTAGAQTGVTPTPSAGRSIDPLSAGNGLAGVFGTLQPGAGPTVPVSDAFRTPGLGFPEGNNRPIGGVENGLNLMTAGHQGSMTQFPVAPGFRSESQVGNSINFAGTGGVGGNSQLASTLEPTFRFADTSVTPQTSTPGSYVYGQGNAGDSNRAYGVPFNIGPGGAGLLNIGGNNVQLSNADKSVGYGYALNAMPSSSVGALTGRNLSEDPASQAAQILMLNAAINTPGVGLAGLMGTNPNQFGGFHAGTGNGPFSGNGGQGQGVIWSGNQPLDPLSQQAGPPSMSPGAGSRGVGSAIAAAGQAIANSLPNPNAPAVSQAMSNAAATIPSQPGAAAMPTQADKYAAAVAALAAAQEEKDRAEAAGYGGGYGVDGGQRAFARGGRIVIDPLRHYASGGSMVTNEPIVGMGVYSHKPRFIVGEDNADPGKAPNSELLNFRPNGMQITPLQPFAGGGQVQTQGPPFRSNEWYLQQIAAAEEERHHNRPVDLQALYSLPYQLAGAGAPTPVNPPRQITIDPGGIPMLVPFAEGGSISTAPTNVPSTFDPLDPNVLAPWQQAAQTLGGQQHLRETVDNPRRRAAGLGNSTGIAVLQGDTPGTNLGAGQFYDQAPQVNNVINQITGNRSDLNALGPAEDVTPIIGQVSEIGIQLDTQQRLRDMATSRIAAAATDEAGRQQAQSKLAGLTAEYLATVNALQNAQYGYSYAENPTEAAQQIYNLTAKLASLQGEYDQTQLQATGPGPNLMAIDAQITALQNSLPEGFNEAQAKTQLTLLNQRVSNQTKRQQLTQQAFNLSKMGVPNLSAPIRPLDPLAARAA